MRRAPARRTAMSVDHPVPTREPHRETGEHITTHAQQRQCHQLERRQRRGQQAATVAFTADGFTLTWTTNAFSNVTTAISRSARRSRAKWLLGTVGQCRRAGVYRAQVCPTAPRVVGLRDVRNTVSLGLAAGPSQQAHLIGYTRFSPKRPRRREVRCCSSARSSRMVGAGVIDARANLQSLDANRFTLTWTQSGGARWQGSADAGARRGQRRSTCSRNPP